MKIAILVILTFSLSSFAADKKASKSYYNELQKARVEFSKGQLKQAVNTYSKIPKGSEYWLEALEEQAHTYGRLGEYNKTMANLKTVLAPQFKGLVGPEPYFVMGLTQLKICDYTGALKTSNDFKENMKERIVALEGLNANEAKIKAIFDRAQKAKKLEIEQLGTDATNMPRFIYRDKWAVKHSQSNYQKFKNRVLRLAKVELAEINKIISKMQIIESEVIQKVNLLAHDDNRPKQGKFAKSSDQLVFPGDKEVWFDELGSFEAQVEKCPSLKQRASL